MKRGMYLQIDLVTARQQRPGIENKAHRAQVACMSSIVGICLASPVRFGCRALLAATLVRSCQWWACLMKTKNIPGIFKDPSYNQLAELGRWFPTLTSSTSETINKVFRNASISSHQLYTRHQPKLTAYLPASVAGGVPTPR